MGALRAFLRDHRQFVIVLTAMALAMKLLIPAGYMVGASAQVLTVRICTDASDAGYVKQITIPVSSKTGGNSDEHGKSDGACPYSVMSMASLGGADATLLVLALAFILTRAFAPTYFSPLVRSRHDRPPLRGPPFMA
jgi:hypothetical protein